ncbi:MAG TPA: PAS domain-containing protein, partial [Desulfopila sp.]|nr:PAS domain-containing protein [Desulfopila sp.]
EELQSTNEELYTVNAEHQNRIIELTELTNDVDNLLTSSRIGTLIIDENKEIRRFSPEITNIFNILDKDIGRPFSHLSHFLVDLDPVAAASRVQKSHQPLEIEVQTRNGKKYLARIVPYQIGPKIYSGVVFTFVDISELSLVRENLQQSRKTEQHIRENVPAGLLVFHQDKEGTLRLTDSNPEAENLTGISVNDHKGALLPDIWPQMGTSSRLDELRGVVETGSTCIVDETEFSTERGTCFLHVHIFRLPDRRLAISFEDQTSRRNYQNRLESSGKRYDTLLKSTDFPWWEWKIDHNSAHLSRALAEITGEAENDVEDIDAYWSKVIHPDDYQEVAANRRKYAEEYTNSYFSSYRLRLQDGTYMKVSEQGEISGWDGQSKASRFIGMVNPVSSSE